MLNRILKTCFNLTLRRQPLKSVLLRTSTPTQCFHNTANLYCKLYYETENAFAFNMLGSLTGNVEITKFLIKNIVVKDSSSFKTFLQQNWRQKSPTEILTAFKTILEYCKLNSINLTNTCFDELTNGLLENIEKFTDEELSDFFDVLINFPACGSYASHNFHDIWSALDDICCMRLSQWSEQEYFSFGDKWYKLGIARYSDFLYNILERLLRRAHRLTKEELVHIFFFMSVCRRRIVDFEYEDALNKKVDEMNLEELSIVAMGFFKTQSKIKSDNIMITMIDRLMDKKNVHEIILSSILKVLRLSSRTNIADHVLDLLKNLDNKLDKLPIISLIHVALLGTTLQIEHKPTLKIIAQKIAENAHDKSIVRLKDLERILLPITMFNFDPKTKPDLFTTALKEIRNPLRIKERVQYPRSLSSALNFLSIRNIYSYELMDEILTDEYIDEIYGKGGKNVPRDLFCLDSSIDIECLDYTGNRMSLEKRYKAAKWLTDFSPRVNYKTKLHFSEKFFIDIYNIILKKICLDETLILDLHVLPHFQRSDLILCREKKSLEFIEPIGFQNYIHGDIMRPIYSENLIWYSIVVGGWNNCARYTGKPLGTIEMKIRQLRKIGFKPILVDWATFGHLNDDERIKLINSKLDSRQ